jgi:hypothetical protein
VSNSWRTKALASLPDLSSLQPRLPPEPWDELSAFRETTLRLFTLPEDRAVFEQLGACMARGTLEHVHLWPHMPSSAAADAARSAQRELRISLYFLHCLGETCYPSTQPPPEPTLTAIAERTARKILPELERLWQAIELGAEAEVRVN